MIIYYIVLLLLFILSLFNPKQKLIKGIFFIVLGIFLCATYFNGSDWRNYELMYNAANIKNFSQFYAEKGFYIYMLLFKLLKFDFWSFFIITKLICFYIFYKRINQMSKNIYLNFMFLYGSWIIMFLFIDCPLRNLISISLFIFAIKYLFEDRKYVYILLIFLAGTIHSTAFFFLFIIFYKKFINISNLYLIVLFVLIFIFFSFQENLIFVLKKLPMAEDRLFYYLNSRSIGQGQIFTLGMLEKLFFFVLFVYKRKNIKEKDIFILSIFYILIYRISITCNILFRFALYLHIFYCLNISNILEKVNKSFKIAIIFIFFIYNNLTFTKNFYKDMILYIPYSNYFSYIYKEKPSYSIRKDYNKNYILEKYGEKKLDKILKRRGRKK